MKTPIFVTIVGSLCCAFQAGNAAVITTLSSTAPSTNVEASYTAASPAGLQWRYDITSGRRDLGQSFLAADSFTMDSFSFQLQQAVPAGAPGASFTVTILQSATVSSIGTAISTQSGTITGLTTGSGNANWLTFDVDNVGMSLGMYYTVMLSFDTQAANQTLNFNSVSAAGGYSNGAAWIYTTGPNYTQPGSDLFFYVQSVSIPEPSSLATFAMAVLFLYGAITIRTRKQGALL